MLIFSIYEVESHISLNKRDGAKKTMSWQIVTIQKLGIYDQAMIL